MTHNKFGRRYRRHLEKHREYFEGMARRIIEEGRATVDLGVTVFDVRLRRRLFWRYLDFIESDGAVSTQRVRSEFKGQELQRMIVGELIHRAAETSGATIPAEPAKERRRSALRPGILRLWPRRPRDRLIDPTR